MDVAAAMPRDPALFVDAIHMTPEGLRLRAWITLQELIPLIEERIASGALPRQDDRPPDLAPPEIEILRTDLECGGVFEPVAWRESTVREPAADVEGG